MVLVRTEHYIQKPITVTPYKSGAIEFHICRFFVLVKARIFLRDLINTLIKISIKTVERPIKVLQLAYMLFYKQPHR